MKLKALSLYDCEKVRQWRNEQLSMLRTSFQLTQEQQERFYYDVVCNRQANARYWGIWKPLEQGNYSIIGMGGIENIQWENRLGEISLLIKPNNIEKFSENALSLILNEGFNNMNLENIYTEVYEINPNCRFWIESANKYKSKIVILPNRKYYNGKYYDSNYINFSKERYNEYMWVE